MRAKGVVDGLRALASPRRRVTLLAAAALVASAGPPLRSQTSATPTAAIDPVILLTQLRHYLTAYETQLGEVVAVERMTQRTGAHGIGGSVYTGRRGIRELESEVAFVGLPGGVGWLGYRDVLKVDGRPTRRTGPSLRALLSVQNAESTDRARALLIAGATYNLGAPRTINLPSLPLEFLHRRNAGRLTATAGVPAAVTSGTCRGQRVDLVESARPTLIQRPQGGDMPSRLSAWVEPASGRLCRAEVRTRDAESDEQGFEALVSVDFDHDAAVELSVPRRMREEFYVPPLGRGAGEATYGDYRRFRTSGRLLPPG